MKIIEVAMVQLAGNILVFVLYWAGGKVDSGTFGDVRNVVEVLSIMKRYLCVHCQ